MNYTIIWKILSLIAFALSCVFTLCWSFDVFSGDTITPFVHGGWATTLAITLFISLTTRLIGLGKSPKTFRKEGLAIIGLGWLLAIILGALPYWTILPQCSFIDALFESASGFTTTGATIFPQIESFPKGLLLWRSLSQWIGGLGVIVLFVALLPSLGAGAKFLYSNEASGQSQDIEASRVQEGALHILWLYIALSTLCTFALRLCGIPWFEALCQMATTLSTGGFSTLNKGIGGFNNPALEWTLIVFMVLGGINFFLMLSILKGKIRKSITNSELIAYFGILLTASAFITLTLTTNPLPISENIRDATFQVVSIATTTGFSTTDYDTWANPVLILILMLSIVGGCSGSTAGGAKVIRVLLSLKINKLQLERSYRSRVRRVASIQGRTISEAEESNILNHLSLLVIILCLGTFLFSILQPHMSLKGVFSGTIACFFNIGPGLSELGPTQTYASLNTPSKLLLSLLMVIGRLELYAILVLCTPAFWRRL